MAVFIHSANICQVPPLCQALLSTLGRTYSKIRWNISYKSRWWQVLWGKIKQKRRDKELLVWGVTILNKVNMERLSWEDDNWQTLGGDEGRVFQASTASAKALRQEYEQPGGKRGWSSMNNGNESRRKGYWQTRLCRALSFNLNLKVIWLMFEKKSITMSFV